MSRLDVGVDEAQLTRSQRAFIRNLRERAIFADRVDDQLRVYPAGTMAAHVLGYTGMQEREVLGEPVLETIGVEGIERTFDACLRGIHGWRLTETDRRRREQVTLRQQDVQPQAGLNVVLSLDAGLQHIVESELAVAMEKHTPVSVSAVAVRPATGEILALATLPTFDPNQPGAAPADHRRNRVIVDPHEPGSTFKVVIVAGALHGGMVTPEERFDCEQGIMYYGGSALRDHDPLDVLSVQEIITKSSNIGAAKIALRMGEARVHGCVADFGFGQRTAIPLPGEEPGIFHPLKKWSKISITRIAMGHEIACTPLQMVMAMSALANGGRLLRPTLVDRLEDEHGRVVARNQPQVVRQAVSEAAARQMVAALKTVVSPEGTGSRAQMEHYAVAGKTGTAQKAGPGGYLPGKYFSSFIGFFPADDPEVCLSVVMDEPRQGYYGGQIAAPVFKAIAERAASYLNVRPDVVAAGSPARETAPGPLTAARSH
jgi:cell division protein FtsI/penicillin-binding protein 2